MKKVLVVFFIIFSFSYLQADEKEDSYNMGLQAYESKDYKQGYDLLSKIYLSNLSDKKINFYLGRCAYEIGEYEVALSAFERVEMLDEGNLRNKLEIARTYFMLEMYENAEIEFQAVLENQNIPQSVRTNIEVYLSKVKKVQQKSFTYASISLDWVYDSNVNYGSNEDYIDNGILKGMQVPNSDTSSDSAAQLEASLVNIYDIGDKNGYALKNRVSLYAKEYFSKHDYDVAYISYIPSLVYQGVGYTAEMGIGMDHISLGNKNYLNSLFLQPQFSYKHSSTLRSLVYAKLQRKYFQQDKHSNLDANHYEFGYGLQKIISPNSYIQGNLIGILEKEVKDRSINVDYDEQKFNLVYANQLTPRYGIELYAELRQRDYSDTNSLFGNTRQDDGGTVSASLNVAVMPKFDIRLKTLYSRVDSNQAVYSYDKYTISAGFIKKF